MIASFQMFYFLWTFNTFFESVENPKKVIGQDKVSLKKKNITPLELETQKFWFLKMFYSECWIQNIEKSILVKSDDWCFLGVRAQLESHDCEEAAFDNLWNLELFKALRKHK